MYLALSPALLILISALFFVFGMGVHPWLRRLPADQYMTAMRSVHAVTTGWPFRGMLLLPAPVLVRTKEFEGPLLIPTAVYVVGVLAASLAMEPFLNPESVTAENAASVVARRWSICHTLRTVAVIVVTSMVLGVYLPVELE